MNVSDLWNQAVYVQLREEIDPFGDSRYFRPLNKAYTGDNTFWSLPSPEPELDNGFWEMLKPCFDDDRIRQAASHLAYRISLWESDGNKLVFAAILRAGVPIADWLCRLIPGAVSVSLSLFVGLGIDRVAVRLLENTYPDRKIVFVDGWTGRGGVAREIGKSNTGPLAVLIDPWGWADFSGTRQDIFCPSACFTGTATLGFSRTFYADDSQLFAAYRFPRKYCRPDIVSAWQMNCPKNLFLHEEDKVQHRFFRQTDLRLHSNEVCRALINADPEMILFSDDPVYVRQHYYPLLVLAEQRKVRIAYHVKELEDYHARAACTLRKNR